MLQPLRWGEHCCPPSSFLLGSGEQVLDDLSSADDIDRPSTRSQQLLLRIDPQAVEDRGAHILDAQRIAVGLGARRIGGAVNVAALDGAAGQHNAEPVSY